MEFCIDSNINEVIIPFYCWDVHIIVHSCKFHSIKLFFYYFIINLWRSPPEAEGFSELKRPN